MRCDGAVVPMRKVDGNEQEGSADTEGRDQNALEWRCPVHGDFYPIVTLTACQAHRLRAFKDWCASPEMQVMSASFTALLSSN